jgi:DHA2 family multidrug resistance protein
MAAFMEILDTSIANVALPHIAGNLAVSNEESTWVLTSYLVSNAMVLPISGWLRCGSPYEIHVAGVRTIR